MEGTGDQDERWHVWGWRDTNKPDDHETDAERGARMKREEERIKARAARLDRNVVRTAHALLVLRPPSLFVPGTAERLYRIGYPRYE